MNVSNKIAYLNELNRTLDLMRSVDSRDEVTTRIKLTCDSIEKDLGMSDTKE